MSKSIFVSLCGTNRVCFSDIRHRRISDKVPSVRFRFPAYVPGMSEGTVEVMQAVCNVMQARILV